LIDSHVIRAEIIRDSDPRIEVETNQGHTLIISLDTTNFPEAAHLVPADERGRLKNKSMYIW